MEEKKKEEGVSDHNKSESGPGPLWKTLKSNPSGCPVPHSTQTELKSDGCVGQFGFDDAHLDPRNMMPAPNQRPHVDQQKPLPTEREKSSIPKFDDEKNSKWVYPSQQMFYNALKRKGKGEDVSEDDISGVVHVHNTMNERTWISLLEWEDFHSSTCARPKLISFRGRPDELSPKARLLTFFGLRPLPFDRHDWIIDRCGTKKVRYIIDYYYDEKRSNKGVDAIDLDVRPALDSFESFKDRIWMALWGKK
eukprot:c3299_g1_i1.p1 GENE.c3299_g1_i1~~c3299_g1_i1.p1  ORF type:complete len:250 (+),score=90.97 c3299_g1_i1:37-786(+)